MKKNKNTFVIYQESTIKIIGLGSLKFTLHFGDSPIMLLFVTGGVTFELY
jgi:hypothetical protein